ncbi:uncharacterized protein METZ01_LOCUS355148, partial [marine metagenome]
LFYILREERPDIIHTHGKGPGLYGRIIGRILKIPVVHTFHGFHYEDLPRITRSIHLAADFFLTLITAQHIFVSRGEKNRARAIKLLDEDNSTIICNGVDLEHIRNISICRKTVLKAAQCEDWEHKKILGTISRLSPEKGILNLLSAFAIANQRIPELKLIIVGGYPEEHQDYYAETNLLIKKKNLKKHIRILGYRQDALEILKCMDFYISSSLSEGLPISMLEACAAEIPIIATEITGNKDILRNSIFGVLTNPTSPENISDGIVKMASMQQAERDILTRNSLNRIKEHFTIEEMTNKTVLIYNQVLHKKRCNSFSS